MDVQSIDGTQEVKISLAPNRPHRGNHILIAGNVEMGKSYMQSQIASNLDDDCFSLAIDTSSFFPKMESIRSSHRFIYMDHLRINPWPTIEGIPANLSDAVINQLMRTICGMAFGLYELNEICSELRQRHIEPNMHEVLKALKEKKYRPGSRQPQYRDTAVIGLTNIVNTSGDGTIFNVKTGMDIKKLLSAKTVLLLSGTAEA